MPWQAAMNCNEDTTMIEVIYLGLALSALIIGLDYLPGGLNLD